MDLLATTVSGDLVDSLTDFERRVASWEHDAKETWSDLIKIGVVIKGLEKVGFRDHLLVNTTEWTKFVNEIENVGATEFGPGRLRPAFVTELGPVLSFQG